MLVWLRKIDFEDEPIVRWMERNLEAGWL